VKILVIGAGVVGSFNAARLTRAGKDVTLLARGRRLAELRAHGVVLEHYRTGERTVTRVPLVDRLAPDAAYDLAIVAVRRNQIPSVLPMLARNRRIPSVVFLGNNAAGADDLVAALGRERVLLGFANAGGERRGHVVRYIWSRWLSLMFGELDGRRTPRADAIASLFGSAGLHARVSPAIDAYLKTHAAGLPGLAGALYSAGGDIKRLARTPEALSLFVRSYREVLRALRDVGVPLTPWFAHLLYRAPERVFVAALRRFFDTELAVVGGQSHANAAVDEMKEIADEVRELLRRSGRATPASDVLFGYVDSRARTVAMATPA